MLLRATGRSSMDTNMRTVRRAGDNRGRMTIVGYPLQFPRIRKRPPSRRFQTDFDDGSCKLLTQRSRKAPSQWTHTSIPTRNQTLQRDIIQGHLTRFRGMCRQHLISAPTFLKVTLRNRVWRSASGELWLTSRKSGVRRLSPFRINDGAIQLNARRNSIGRRANDVASGQVAK